MRDNKLKNHGYLTKCPKCEHILHSSPKVCPYCFEPIGVELDKNTVSTLLTRIKEVSAIAVSREIHISNIIESIKIAERKFKKGKIQEAHRILQENYITLARNLSIYMLDEEERYEMILTINGKSNENFRKFKIFVEQWKFKDASEKLNKIKSQYEKLTQEIEFYLEELERAERALELAEYLGINIEPAAKVIDLSKDEADKREYSSARRILKSAFLPLEPEVQRVMEDLLETITTQKDGIFEDKIVDGRMRSLLQELKFYWKGNNIIEVIEHLTMLKKEIEGDTQ